jgi:hypothetical protein
LSSVQNTNFAISVLIAEKQQMKKMVEVIGLSNFLHGYCKSTPKLKAFEKEK